MANVCERLNKLERVAELRAVFAASRRTSS
jgi:hypothetical protein